MPQPTTPRQELRKFILVLVFAGLFLFALKAGLVSVVSDRFVQKFVEETLGQPEDRAEERVAQSTFVPLVRKKYPDMTADVPDSALVALAVSTCSTLDADGSTDQEVLRQQVVEAFPGASKPAAMKVLRDIVSTTCPMKDPVWLNAVRSGG